MSLNADSLSLSITILSNKSTPSTAVPHTKTTQGGLARPLRKDDKCNSIFFWNDTEKNSMDKRKDDMHEPRNVVKFFFFEQE